MLTSVIMLGEHFHVLCWLVLCVAHLGFHAWPCKGRTTCWGAGRPCWLWAVGLEVCAQLGAEIAELGVTHL